MAKHDSIKTPATTPQKPAAIVLTDADIRKLEQIGCALDMLQQLGRILPGGDEETAVNTGIMLAKEKFWSFHYELIDRGKGAV